MRRIFSTVLFSTIHSDETLHFSMDLWVTLAPALERCRSEGARTQLEFSQAL